MQNQSLTRICKVWPTYTLGLALMLSSVLTCTTGRSEQPCNGPAPRYALLRGNAIGTGQTVCATPYAYGWFGAAPRTHIGKATTVYGGHRYWASR